MITNQERKDTEILQSLSGKKILITGGTGSFARCFVEYLLENAASLKEAPVLILYSRDESKQQELKQELTGKQLPFVFHLVIGDVRDIERLDQVMRIHKPHYVLHAAAMKHVDICEINPEETIKTNIIGSKNVVDICKKYDVLCALHLSADKAVHPAGMYGTTKQIAERLFSGSESNTRFVNLRYSNVLGSRGSVIQTFHQILLNNGQIKVFGDSMTRLVLTQREVVEMVLYSLSIPVSGTLLKKCPKIFIKDLAKIMVEITGKGSYIVLPTKRAGEKDDALLYSDEEAKHVFALNETLFIIDKTKECIGQESYGTHNARQLTEEEIKTLIKPLLKV